jgi:hypothetical protein
MTIDHHLTGQLKTLRLSPVMQKLPPTVNEKLPP